MAKRKKCRQWTSPIELMMRNALVVQARDVASHNLEIYDRSTHIEPSAAIIVQGAIAGVDHDSEDYEGFGNGPDTWDMYSAVLVDSYRVDLLIHTCMGLFVAVECDGHDYHDRTKQQASSDRARDRALLRLGLFTLRFTGSDIYHDADQCAVEVIETVRLMEQQSYEAGRLAAMRAAYKRENAQSRRQFGGGTSAGLLSAGL